MEPKSKLTIAVATSALAVLAVLGAPQPFTRKTKTSTR